MASRRKRDRSESEENVASEDLQPSTSNTNGRTDYRGTTMYLDNNVTLINTFQMKKTRYTHTHVTI